MVAWLAWSRLCAELGSTRDRRGAMVKNTGRPGYLQIADDLREQIRRGTLIPGDPLPSTTQLATTYEASLSVVKLAVGGATKRRAGHRPAGQGRLRPR
ncbi:GntR family transcriptional regulator [Streptosporangium vulgare]|uniref:GntR family transcriptional regulator n=1 Tax=Streptosporangium vulgare TaxID=46190 RepID=UPI0031D55D65